MSNKTYTYEYCKEIALKYKTRSELKLANPTAFGTIYSNKWTDLFDHMIRFNLPNGYWTYERCKEEALKYKFKSDFTKAKGSCSAVIPAKKNGWWDEITAHMDRKPFPKKYTKETALQEANKYSRRTDILHNDPGLYYFLRNNNLMNKLLPLFHIENKTLLEQGKRKCKICEQILDLTNFRLNNNKIYNCNCIKCQKKYNKEYWESVRESNLKPNGLVAKQKLWAQGLKECTKCGEIKNIDSDFYTHPTRKTKVGKCRVCLSEENKAKRPKKEFGVAWKLGLKKEGKKWCNSCKQAKDFEQFGIKKTSKDGRMVTCKECKSKIDKKYREDPRFRNRILEQKKQHYEKIKHTEEYKKYAKHRNDIRDYKKEYKHYISDEFNRFKTRIRGRINSYFRVNRDWVKKDTRTIDLLGVDYFVAKEFLERQFLKGMTWENYGSEWHIDHTIPLDAAGKDKEKAKKLCYYQNLSPMWGPDNLNKSWKVPNICTLWENPIVPYKVNEIVIIPKHQGIVGDYKLLIPLGTRYGKLTVIGDAPKMNNKRSFRCKCDCGNELDVYLNSLRQGTTKSCGCYRLERIKENSITRERLFNRDELMILKEYVNKSKKFDKVSDKFLKLFPNKTKAQVIRYIREIRNNNIKI